MATMMSSKVAADAAEPPEAAVLSSVPCMVVVPSNALVACHVTVKGTIAELSAFVETPDGTAVEPLEVAASSAEPPEVSVVPTYQLSAYPFTAMEAICELSSCPVTAKEAGCELSPCPVTAKEAICELSPCPVTVMEAVGEPLLRSGPADRAVIIPVHALLFTHHQRSLAHHIDSCTTQTVARHLKLLLPSSIALTTHTAVSITLTPENYHTLYKPWTFSPSRPSIVCT